jgi:predicted Zn-ribbon and HTH transcriptional regulator
VIITPQLDELKEIELQLLQLSFNLVSPKNITNGYNADGTRVEKALFILKKQGKGLTVTEIVNLLGSEYDKDLTATKDTYRTEQARFATTLKINADKTEGTILLRREESQERGFIYGLPEWFDGKVLKSEYK